MSLESIETALFSARDNPRLPVIGVVVFCALIPFVQALMALDRLVCSFSCGASLVDQLIYWPSEALTDLVENFPSIFVLLKNLTICFLVPFLLAHWLEANEIITSLATWVPLYYFFVIVSLRVCPWVARTADKLIDSNLANRIPDEENDGGNANERKPELKRNQKFIL